MTTKIKWRLGKLPDPSEVTLLLKEGVLTKDEAREILFSQVTEEDRDKESLQQEIKFLRELVNKLSNRYDIVQQIRYIEKPYITTPWWSGYQTYCNTASNLDSSSTLTYSSGLGTVNSYAMNASSLGSQTSGSVAFGNSDAGFNDIKTF